MRWRGVVARRHATGPLLLVLVACVAGLVWLQLSWLSQLSRETRAKLQRDLSSSLERVALDVELELTRLHLAVAFRGDGDAASIAADLARWKTQAGVIGAIVRAVQSAPNTAEMIDRPGFTRRNVSPMPAKERLSGSPLIIFDSAAIVNRLVRHLETRVTADIGQRVTLAARLAPAGLSDSVVFSAGMGRPPDAGVLLIRDVGAPRRLVVFRGSGAALSPMQSDMRFDWSQSSAKESDQPSAGDSWRLDAWLVAGSFAQVADQWRWRYLAVGFGLLAILVVAGGMLVGIARNHEKLAMERAAIFAGVSHELRTPVAVIQSAAENLASGVIGSASEVAEYGALIERAAARLDATVEGTLTLAKSLGTGMPGLRERIDLWAVVRGVVDTLPDGARVAMHSRGPVYVLAQRPLLDLALTNLLRNALDYSPPETVVTVAVEQLAGTGRIAIRDSGPGIAAEDALVIFAPFVRGGAALNASHNGSGLGLTIARRAAEVQGGHLRLANPGLPGAEFHLEFKVA